MSARSPTLSVRYTGEPVRVDRTAITEDMRVPTVDRHDPRADDLPGRVTVGLYCEAEEARALVVPEGLLVDCGCHDDEYGATFIIVARDKARHEIGVTTGWHGVEILGRSAEDERAANDPDLVARALWCMAFEINRSLRR